MFIILNKQFLVFDARFLVFEYEIRHIYSQSWLALVSLPFSQLVKAWRRVTPPIASLFQRSSCTNCPQCVWQAYRKAELALFEPAVWLAMRSLRMFSAAETAGAKRAFGVGGRARPRIVAATPSNLSDKHPENRHIACVVASPSGWACAAQRHAARHHRSCSPEHTTLSLK